MRLHSWIGSCLAFGVSLAGVAHAGDGFPGDEFFMTPNVSTLGPGIEAGIRLNDQWGLRAGINGMRYSYVYHDKKADLESTLTLLNGGVTVDYYPWSDGWRLSGGLRVSANEIRGRVKNLRGKVRFGSRDVIVFVDDPLTTFKVTQNPVQPYFGAGYSVKLKDRVSLDFDLGLLYSGKPDLDVTSHAYRYGFTRRQIERETARYQDRISPFQVYPVIQVGLNIRF